ncbi:MAG: SDR family oxidoreductase [Ornithinimicrobium sp.]
MKLALTGATGHVGGAVAHLLADRRPRLIVRDPSRAPDIPGSAVVVASYRDAQALRDALVGIDTLLLVSAAEASDRREQHRTAIQAAADAGVKHIVYTSFCGASADAAFTLGRDHADAEKAITETSLVHTFLRNNFYAEVLPSFADEARVIRGPAAQGRVAAVARQDVAEVAAAIMRDPQGHEGQTYDLSGPEALSMTEVADRLAALRGHEVRYEEETVEQAYASRRAAYPEAADFLLDAWVSTYTAIASGAMAEVTGDVRAITGNPARTLEQALG